MDDRLAKVRLLILDVDGVMTDGRIILDARGEETKQFHVRDGHGLKLLIQAGIEVVIISGRDSRAVEFRARQLGIRRVYQGVANKAPVLKELIERGGFEKDQVCCVGDDLPDLPLFGEVGISIAVADAVPELLEEATLVTEKNGGAGAVREVCDWILKAGHKWPDTTKPSKKQRSAIGRQRSV